MNSNRKGNCYATCEALYHLLGGRAAGWKAMRARVRGESECHWFLKHSSGLTIDPTKSQFRGKAKPDYANSVGTGFLTKKPSKAAKRMMKLIVWTEK